MAGRTIDDCLHTLHIGLPGTIGTPMRVRDLNAEGHALVAKLALCHPLHLLAVAYLEHLFIGTSDILTDCFLKCKDYFQKISVFSQVFLLGSKMLKVLRNLENSYIIFNDILRPGPCGAGRVAHRAGKVRKAHVSKGFKDRGFCQAI